MAERISRRKLATFAAGAITSGEPVELILEQLAAYLIETSREREADLLARTIEDALAERGVAIARMSTARPIDDEMRDAVKRLLQASTLHLHESVDPSLIGGVLVEAPGKRLDATIKRKILALEKAKI